MCATTIFYTENQFVYLTFFTLVDRFKIVFLSLPEEGPHCKLTVCLYLHCLFAFRATDHHRASPLFIGELLVDNSKQRREIAINYQEALKQQVHLFRSRWLPELVIKYICQVNLICSFGSCGQEVGHFTSTCVVGCVFLCPPSLLVASWRI